MSEFGLFDNVTFPSKIQHHVTENNIKHYDDTVNVDVDVDVDVNVNETLHLKDQKQHPNRNKSMNESMNENKSENEINNQKEKVRKLLEFADLSHLIQIYGQSCNNDNNNNVNNTIKTYSSSSENAMSFNKDHNAGHYKTNNDDIDGNNNNNNSNNDSNNNIGWYKTLTRGEIQRICLCRVLFNRPKFAILDESTNALDEEMERKFYNEFKRLKISVISIGRLSNLKAYHN